MTGCPMYYNYANRLDLKGVNLDQMTLTQMFTRALLQRAMSAFKWLTPDSWDKNFFLYCLYEFGYVAVIPTIKYGVIPMSCGLSGYNVFYRPSKVVIANPLLPDVGEIPIHSAGAPVDGQCALLQLQPDYGGVLDTVRYYAEQLALASQDVGVNLINCKLSYVFAARNKAIAETFKKLYAEIAAGKPAVVVDSKLFNEDGTLAMELFTQDVGANFVADKLLEIVRGLLDQYDTEIGLPNANTRKKERMIVDEVNANNAETASRCELWLECLRTGIKSAKDLWPDLELSVDWRFKPETESVERGVDNVDN